MTAATTNQQELKHYAEEAGILLDGAGHDHICLIARVHDFAITAEAKIVMIDRPDEWPDGRYGSWFDLDINRIGEDGARYVIALIEYIMELPSGTLDCESIKPTLRAFASGMRVGLLYQPAEGLVGGNGSN